MSTPSELRVQVKSLIRELIVLGDNRQSILKKIGEEFPDVAPSAIETYQKQVRRGMAITEGEKTKRLATSRGILRQRLEYLYHLCVSPDKGKPDVKVAMEALKMLMALDGLGGPVKSRPASARKEKFLSKQAEGHIETRMKDMTDEQLLQLAGGSHEGRITKDEVDDMDVEVQ